MARCQNCAREGPAGAVYCLECGSRLPASSSTPMPDPRLPAAASGQPGQQICAACNGANQGGMNFCRHCGHALHPSALASVDLSHAPTPIAQPPPPAPQPGPLPAMPPVRSRSASPTPPGIGRDRLLCRRCGGHTAVGFTYCQHCGAPLEGRPAVDGRADTVAGEAGMAALAARGVRPAAPGMFTPTAAAAWMVGGRTVSPTVPSPPPRKDERAAPWGTLVAVRRDGTDGDRIALTGDWLEVGRDADLSFDDRYLANRHARFDHVDGAVRIQPIDVFNGVFRRIRGREPLGNGTILLFGRELLRFELVEPDERDIVPLVRQGVAMFGSPPRKPWGRLVQLLASGGVRDIRHLNGPEVVIGREEGDLIFRDDEFLSRRHAALRCTGAECEVEDLNSSNGSFVRLRTTTTLAPGDTLRMGDQMFRFVPVG